MSKEDEYAAVYALTNLGNTSTLSPVLVSQFHHCPLPPPQYTLSFVKEDQTVNADAPAADIHNEDDEDNDDDDEPESVDPHCNNKFPLKLFDILDSRQYSDMIQWLPQGIGFLFVNKKRFEAEVLPLFFKKRIKFTSFTRRLIRWGFTRIPRGNFLGSYFHSLFQEGKRSLCVELCNRLREKKTLMKHNQQPLSIIGVNKIGVNELNHTHRNINGCGPGKNTHFSINQHQRLFVGVSSGTKPFPNPLMDAPSTAISFMNNKPSSPTHQDPNTLKNAYYAQKKEQEFKKIVLLRLIEQKRQHLMLQNQYMQMANAQNQQRLLSILRQAGYSYPFMTTATNASVAMTAPQPVIPGRTQTLGGDLYNNKSIYGAYAA